MKEALRLMQSGQWGQALARVDQVLIAAPKDAQLWVFRAQCLMGLGSRAEAFAAADAAERYAPDNPLIRDAAGTLYSFGRDQHRALAAYDAAVALAPDNPQFRYNRASIRRFLGDLDGAEQDFDHAIAVKPKDYEAYKNRTDLRRQTPDRNHIAELEAAASSGITDWRGEVQVRYALAKEYEDLERYEESFEELARATRKRREHMRYEVSTDLATVNWIMTAFPEGPKTPPANACGDAPIFVIGLPRSGTTLVERILGSHSTLVSAGELDSFALCIVDAVRRQSGRAQLTRQELVTYSAELDFAALGHAYLRHAQAVGDVAGRFIDKMPLNYLYCGLIRRALPRAKLVHLTRHPLAVCYAMYKTLFRDGYPFSYDLTEIGQYYLGYRQLMTHWNASMPGAIYELNYEALIADQLGETGQLLAFCGLGWEEACLQFHENPAASTTASAAQVRRPIYDSSLSQWRHYEQQLKGLRQQLEAAGVEL
jgi:tetratricopeptide (TPR) repeat protein